MVSTLWKACSSGDLETVRVLLNETTTDSDIEVKDHIGVTPLIEAVKNGHVEVVKALLDKGADPRNASSQGPPSSYTSDERILDLLGNAQTNPLGAPQHPPSSVQSANNNAENPHQYESSMPVDYTYYPTINSTLSPPPEGGAVYYAHSPLQNTGENGGLGNLPPPEIAKMIPCRYFPACRYGASCIFAHPQQYYPASLPHQYITPYDPVNAQPYPPNYFPPPPFQSPSGIHSISPMSPPSGSHTGHGNSPSEVPLPSQPPFSPNSVPSVSYGPMPPNTYPPPGQAPPMIMPPLPPQPQIAMTSQPSSNMYHVAPPPVTPYVQQDGSLPYPVAQVKPLQDLNGDVKAHDGTMANNSYPHHRDGSSYQRRGGRRGSLNNRVKPPCIFFPSGRCKNGDDCRFPHVLPENNGPQSTSYFSGRGGARPRNVNGNGTSHNNGKFDDHPQHNSEATNRLDQGRHRFHQGSKNGHGQNTNRLDKRLPSQKQRVPNADEFPVLAGSATPPTRNTSANGTAPNGNGHIGPTAAQILQAPPPPRREIQQKSSTRSMTLDPDKSLAFKVETNGVVSEATSTPTPTSINTTAANTTHDHSTVKLSATFATVAAPEMPKEITLSA